MKGEIGVKLKDLENCWEEKHPELIKNKTKQNPKHTHTVTVKNSFYKSYSCQSAFLPLL